MPRESFWRSAFAAAGIFLAASGLCAQPAPEPATEIVPKQLVTARRFMVVAAHPLAAREAKLEAYDGRETAPAGAKPGRFLGTGGKPLDWPAAVISGKSVGVPGLLRLLELAHRRHGKLPWAQLFDPAIKLAQEGFPISPRLSALIAADRFLPLDANARRYFYLADGKARPAGTLLKNPEFAAVLKRVAARGAAAFYRGEIARDIAAAVRSHKRGYGDLAEADLAVYTAIQREPLCGAYRRWRVCGMPPPSSGGFAVLQILE